MTTFSLRGVDGEDLIDETSASSRPSRKASSLMSGGESIGDSSDLAALLRDLCFILEGLIRFSCVIKDDIIN